MTFLRPAQHFFRALQFTSTLLVLSLAGALLHQNRHGGTPTRINYSIYAAVFAMFSLCYLLTAHFFQRIHHPAISIPLDLLNAIFMGCAAVAMSASMGGKSCADRNFLDSSGICQGSGKRCSEANAMTAFEWIAMIGFVGALLIGLEGWRRERGMQKLSRGRGAV